LYFLCLKLIQYNLKKKLFYNSASDICLYVISLIFLNMVTKWEENIEKYKNAVVSTLIFLSFTYLLKFDLLRFRNEKEDNLSIFTAQNKFYKVLTRNNLCVTVY
jgi:surface polysaccharide O-acyltransferase-like enzyme